MTNENYFNLSIGKPKLKITIHSNQISLSIYNILYIIYNLISKALFYTV